MLPDERRNVGQNVVGDAGRAWKPIAKGIEQSTQEAQDKTLTWTEGKGEKAQSNSDLAFLARELVQCTLPHSDPKKRTYKTTKNLYDRYTIGVSCY